MAEQTMDVEVAYATLATQVILPVQVPATATVREVIERSGILKRFPDIDLDTNKVGVFGKVAALDATLAPGDRVEIYRPLIADPKEQRKKRAAEGKVMKKGGGESPTEGG